MKAAANSPARLIIAAIVVALLIGLMLWPPSYQELNESLPYLAFVVCSLIGGVIFSARDFAPTLAGGFAAGCGGPLSYAVRIIIDTMADPTHHNLWPLAMIMVGAISIPSGIAGALAGLGMRRLFSGRRSLPI